MTSSKPGPLYQQIKDTIRKSIVSGQLQPHDRVGSEFELAEQFHVSRVTTRQALSLLEQEGIIYRIQGKGSFVSEIEDDQVNPEEQMTLGVIVPYIHDIFTMGLIDGIEKCAREHGYRTVIASSDNNIEQEAELINQMRMQSVSGMIIWPADCPTYNEAILRLKLDDYPFVLADRYMEHVPTDYVISDNFQGAFLATKHLLDFGHRRIGFVSPRLETTLTARLRHKGYLTALRQADIEPDQDLMHEVESSIPDYHEKLRVFLRRFRPSAVFASNDIIAMMVFRAAYEEGVECPKQLSLVGFDNLGSASHLPVPLTSVDQNVQQIGKQTVSIVIAKISDHVSELSQVVIPTKLVVRESCLPYDSSEDLYSGAHSGKEVTN